MLYFGVFFVVSIFSNVNVNFVGDRFYVGGNLMSNTQGLLKEGVLDILEIFTGVLKVKKKRKLEFTNTVT